MVVADLLQRERSGSCLSNRSQCYSSHKLSRALRPRRVQNLVTSIEYETPNRTIPNATAFLANHCGPSKLAVASEDGSISIFDTPGKFQFIPYLFLNLFCSLRIKVQRNVRVICFSPQALYRRKLCSWPKNQLIEFMYTRIRYLTLLGWMPGQVCLLLLATNQSNR